ncbi:hypothetical protein GYMLUDRAFT_411553 [Collybiopsis luxurians FD-317 M1]|nr:hypothetical protein GYMLUDRAFT_411553 [Collybiopsis luxurians FD-317 M1]
MTSKGSIRHAQVTQDADRTHTLYFNIDDRPIESKVTEVIDCTCIYCTSTGQSKLVLSLSMRIENFLHQMVGAGCPESAQFSPSVVQSTYLVAFRCETFWTLLWQLWSEEEYCGRLLSKNNSNTQEKTKQGIYPFDGTGCFWTHRQCLLKKVN